MKKGIIFIIVCFSLCDNSFAASNEILLKSRHFTPVPGITDAAKEKIQSIGERAHVLLQLEDDPTSEQKELLESQGIKLLAYIPNNAWFSSIPTDRVVEITGLSGVRAITEILPGDKIAPSIRNGGVSDYSTAETGEAKLIVIFFNDVPLDKAAEEISSYNGTVIDACPITTTLVVYLPKEVISELAREDSVQWINQHYEPGLLNDGARAAVYVNEVQDPPYSLTGIGVKVGQWDAACVDDTHDDLQGRVELAICDGGRFPFFDPFHATHVAGTLAGNGTLSSGTYRGMAPNARIFSYNYWFDSAECRSDYLDAISNYDIDLSNNSWEIPYFCNWGGHPPEPPGVYDDIAEAEDDVVIGACGKKIPLIFGAGNGGNMVWFGCDPPWRTLGRTAVAKNIITVGATNTDDNSLAPFSGRGPTADGRVKPDVVAPGCDGTCLAKYCPSSPYDPDCPNPPDWIFSTRPVDKYGGMNGTSCATPVVSGTVALMLEQWRNTHTGEPLPSTIKAILIQTAMDLVVSPCTPGPDYSSGYGLINALAAIDLISADTPNNDVILERTIITGNDIHHFIIYVPQARPELKITLVWDDYPGTYNSDEDLQNDLDLIVIDPSGTRHFPWILNPEEGHEGDPAVTGEDHKNNVEQVSVANPADGFWEVQIRKGIRFPWSNQSYSLVANFPLNCFPGNYTTYNDWVTMGRPDCWCAKSIGSGYQCDGDADGKTSGAPYYYRIFTGDLYLVSSNWKKKIDDPTLNPCADIDHKSSGAPYYYRVYSSDLNRVTANWKKTDDQLPCDCPRSE